MPFTNRRGRAVHNMAARLGMQVANQGSVFTYRWPGFRNSIPDVTFASERVAGLIRRWRVSEKLTGSDHQYMLFKLTNSEKARPATRSVRWSVKKLDRERLVDTLQEAADSLSLPTGTTSREGVENLVERTMALITRACDDSMPRKSVNP